MPQDNKKVEISYSSGAIKVSLARFDELVSLYLDAEISNDELKLLAYLVKNDARAANAFNKACRIHLATCRLFGKKQVTLLPLPQIKNPRAAKRLGTRRATAEWSIVAALVFVSIVMFKFSSGALAVENEYSQAPEMSEFDSAYEVFVNQKFTILENACSIFSIKDRGQE